MVLQSTLPGGAAGGSIIGKITITQVNSGAARGGLLIIQRTPQPLYQLLVPLLPVVLQSTLGQLHKLPQSVLLHITMDHLRSLPVPVARVVLQNILH